MSLHSLLGVYLLIPRTLTVQFLIATVQKKKKKAITITTTDKNKIKKKTQQLLYIIQLLGPNF